MVCVSASTQLNPKEMASTTNRGFTISATAEGARYNGRNEQMAMNVAPSKPHCGPVAPSISAFLRSIPRAMAICALSVTTMALSTSIPMAMMKPAREVRFSPTPMKDMMSNVPPMVNSSELPISIPARSPITSMMITITMRRDSIRLMMKPLFAS